MSLLGRHLAPGVSDLLGTFRLVILGGARQSGKTTLVRQQLGLPPTARLSFDDEGTLEPAENDPVTFVDGLSSPTAVDEFQRAGEPLICSISGTVRDPKSIWCSKIAIPVRWPASRSN